MKTIDIQQQLTAVTEHLTAADMGNNQIGNLIISMNKLVEINEELLKRLTLAELNVKLLFSERK